MENLNKIALVGGTGKAGSYVVKQLINKGYRLRVLLRNPDQFDNTNSLVEKVKGDVRDYNSLLALIEGCSTVISTLGQSKGEPPVYSLAITNIINAMQVNNVKRYITVTGLTLDVEGDKKSFRTKLLSKIMKMSFPAIVADKQKDFSILEESELHWTVVRLPLIEQTESVGKVKSSLFDSPGKKISATDLADFLMQQISDDQFIRKAPFIAN